MQVLGDKDSPLHYPREIQCERLDNVTRPVRAIIDNYIELRRALKHTLTHIRSISIADDSVDACIIEAQMPAVWIDITTDQGCCIVEVI